MPLPWSDLRVSSINATFGVNNPRAIFYYNGGSGSEKSQSDFNNLVSGTLSSACPGSTQTDKKQNLLNDKQLSYFKGYYDDSQCGLWEIECYDGNSTSTQPLGSKYLLKDVYITPDGWKMYILSFYNGSTSYVHEYILDIKNSFSGMTENYVIEVDGHKGLDFGDDGNKLYVADNYNIYQYNLGDKFDLTTLSSTPNADETLDLYSINSKLDPVSGIEWNGDGTRLYFTTWNTSDYDNIRYVNIASTAKWSIGGYQDLGYYGIGTNTSAHEGLRFSSDGSRAYLNKNWTASRVLEEITLSTHYDITTGTYNSEYIGILDDVMGFSLSSNGYYLFHVEDNNNNLTRITHNII